MCEYQLSPVNRTADCNCVTEWQHLRATNASTLENKEWNTGDTKATNALQLLVNLLQNAITFKRPAQTHKRPLHLTQLDAFKKRVHVATWCERQSQLAAPPAKQLNGSIKSSRITRDGDTSFGGGGGENSMVGGRLESRCQMTKCVLKGSMESEGTFPSQKYLVNRVGRGRGQDRGDNERQQIKRSRGKEGWVKERYIRQRASLNCDTLP